MKKVAYVLAVVISFVFLFPGVSPAGNKDR